MVENDLIDLRYAFENSRLPMRVDVVDWAATAPNFQAIIQAQCEDVSF